MNELMLRLIKDGKIVGYKWFCKGEEGYSHKRNYMFSDLIEWDFVELGIKVGDEWYFDGDRLCFEDGETKLTGTIKWYLNRWLVFYEDGATSLLRTDAGYASCIKRIGNTHEKAGE